MSERRQSHATLNTKVKQKNLSKLRNKYYANMKTPTADDMDHVISFDAYKSRKESNATSMVVQPSQTNQEQQAEQEKPDEDKMKVEETTKSPQMFGGPQEISLKSPAKTVG